MQYFGGALTRLRFLQGIDFVGLHLLFRCRGIQQGSHRDAEHLGQMQQILRAGCGLSGFPFGDRLPGQAEPLSQLFLRQPGGLPRRTDAFAQSLSGHGAHLLFCVQYSIPRRKSQQTARQLSVAARIFLHSAAKNKPDGT